MRVARKHSMNSANYKKVIICGSIQVKIEAPSITQQSWVLFN